MTKKRIIEEIVFQQLNLVRAPLTNLSGLTTLFLRRELTSNVDSSSTCKMILDSTKQLDNIIRGQEGF
jgi:hypothetical protein